MQFLYFLESIRNPVLDVFFSVVTEFGGEAIFIALAIGLFWCLDKKAGYYMLTVGFAGMIVSQFLKIFCRIPRPWVKDPNFTIVESAREAATGYSFPSGHTQSAFTVLGTPARWWTNTKLRIFCIVMIVLVGLSRMYLGVHSPADVGVSALFGTILVFGMYPLFKNMDENPKPVYILYVVFIIAAGAFVAYMEFNQFPADIDMANYESALKHSWEIFFCAIGLLLVFHVDRTKLQFPTAAPFKCQVIKVAVGAAVALGMKSGLKAPLLALLDGNMMAHGIRYFVMILFAGIIWPMTFRWFEAGMPRKEK